MDSKEQEFKKKAFGEVTNRPSGKSHDFKPDKEKLKSPLLEGAGLRIFCIGCGQYHELELYAVKEIQSIMKIEILPSKHYFEISGCYLCNSSDIGSALKNIDDGAILYKLGPQGL